MHSFLFDCQRTQLPSPDHHIVSFHTGPKAVLQIFFLPEQMVEWISVTSKWVLKNSSVSLLIINIQKFQHAHWLRTLILIQTVQKVAIEYKKLKLVQKIELILGK